jgi:hypothetical protein
VLVKKLERTNNDTIIRREETYFKDVTEKPISGDVELFS